MGRFEKLSNELKAGGTVKSLPKTRFDRMREELRRSEPTTTEAHLPAAAKPKRQVVTYTDSGSLVGGGSGRDRTIRRNLAAQPYSLGTSLKNTAKKGLHAIAQAGADTLAFGEDLVLAPVELTSGLQLGDLSDRGPLNTLAGKVRKESEETHRKAQANMEKGGTPAKLLENWGAATIAAVPNAALAMMTSGGSAAAQTTAGLTRAAAAAKAPGMAAALSRAAGSKVRDPQFWTSFGQMAGGSYENALAEQREMEARKAQTQGKSYAGTNENSIRTKAALYALGTGLTNAAVEVGGGIETLPGELKAGKGAWKSFVDSMVDEGKEEVVQGVIERALKNPVYGAETPMFSTTDERAVFNPGTMAGEFAGGVAVGGLLGGGQIGISKALDAGIAGRAAGRASNQTVRPLTATQGNVEGTDTAGAESASRGPVDMARELDKFRLRGAETQAQAPAAQVQTPAEQIQPQAAQRDVLEQDVWRIYKKDRVPLQDLTKEQRTAVEAASDTGTVDADAENKVYRVNPEEHIDRRSPDAVGDRNLRAFQFDHPQLHPYYVQAAQTLLTEMQGYYPGGETVSKVSEDGYPYSYRAKRLATPRIAKLIDDYGVKPSQIEDALGAADRGGVNTAFEDMQAEADTFHPVNPTAEARLREERGRAPSEVPVESAGTGKNIMKTVSTILNSPLTSNEMARVMEDAIPLGKFDYTKVTDRDAAERALNTIRRGGGYKEAARNFILQVNEGRRVTKDDSALATVAYSQAVEAQDAETVFDLFDAFTRSSHDSAQALQAVNLFNRMTPAGKLLSLRRLVDRMNARQRPARQRSRNTVDAETQQTNFVEEQTGMAINPDLAEKYMFAENEADRQAAWEAIIQDLAKQKPKTLLERWDAWRYLSMLTNPTTHIRNMAGNVAFGSLQRRVKNFLGAGLESAVIRDRSQRTKSFSLGKDGKALKEFAKQMYQQDQAAAMGEGKYNEGGYGNIEREIREQEKFLWKPFQWAADQNSALLEKEDALFSKPAYIDSLAQALRAKGVTAEEAVSGQKGDLVADARAYAIREAQRATFRDANAFSDFVSKWGRVKDESNLFDRVKAGAMDVLMPFRRTPANVLARGVEYSPAGLLKAISYDAVQVSRGNMAPSDMLDHLASGLTGSGVFALGAFLAAQGLLKLRPGDDDRERNFLADAGSQDFSLQLGDHSYTLGWLSPAAMPLFAGAAMTEAAGSENVGMLESFLSAMSGVTDAVLETSMLSSLDELLDGIGYAESKPWYLISQTVMDLVGQGVPTVLSKIASAADDTVRSSYVQGGKTEPGEDISYFLQGLERKIPGLRQNLQPKIDLWGREQSNGGTGERLLENFLSPGYYSRVSGDAVNRELQRLSEAAGDTHVYPDKVEKSFTLEGGATKYLTAEEYTSFAKNVGQTRREILEGLFSKQGYQKLSDRDKAKVVQEAYSYATAVGKRALVGSAYEPDKWVLNVMKSPLPPADAILYKRFRSNEEERTGSASQANENTRKAIFRDSSLTPRQKNLLDDFILSDGFYIPQEKDVDYSSEDSFIVSQMSDSAVKHWDVVREALPEISGKEYEKAWEIFNRKGTKEEPYTKERKKRDLREELGLSWADVEKIYGAMKKEIE